MSANGARLSLNRRAQQLIGMASRQMRRTQYLEALQLVGRPDEIPEESARPV